MSTEMESRQGTPSVIARLMGLDELSHNQPVHKKQKVLSENYLKRIASVGVRGKRSSHGHHSFRLIAEENKEFKDTFEVHGKLKKEEHCNLPVEKGKYNSTLSAAKEVGDAQGVVDYKIDLFMEYLQESDSLITDHLCNLQGNPYNLRSGCLTFLKSSNASDTRMTDQCSISGKETDKLETILLRNKCGGHVPGNGYKLLESQKESDNLPTKIVVLKPKRGNKENAVRCFPSCSFCGDCLSVNKKYNSPEKGNLYAEEKQRTKGTKNVEHGRLRFRISGKTSGQTGLAESNLSMKVSKSDSRDSDRFQNDSELKTFVSPNSCEWKNHQKPLFYHSDESYVGREERKEILERLGRLQHRIRKQNHNQKKGSEYRNSGSSCMMSQSFPCLESTNSYLVRDDCVLQGEPNRELGEKDTCEQTNLEINSSVDSFALASMTADMLSDAESGFEGQSSENHKDKHLEKTDCKPLVEDGCFSSLFSYASPQQDMSIGMFKEDYSSSLCSCIYPESLLNSEEAYQSSPNSVLEPPSKKQILSSSSCFQGVEVNLQELQLQLELLKSDSSETYSEGDGMIVSSDDEFEQASVSNAEKSEQFMRTFGMEEGRDFSYLVDVFTEAGFHSRNSGTSNETWHSLEYPIKPAVFEMLEKKYSELISWKRSDRRFLFDRINSQLMEILRPSMGSHWTKPLSTRLCFGKTLDMIEEDLWMLLNRCQKKQTNKDSSVKMMGMDDRWLELGDDIEVIVKEIEASLIDQLATEVVCMESF